jgi:RNA 3'-terminal phosphate cyclase (ATP)
MGARMDVQLLRHGFMPSGGGSIAAKIEPCARYQPTELLSRGEEKPWRARALVSKLPDDLGARQLDALLDRFERKRLKFDATKLERVEADDAGNALLLELPHGDLCDVLCAFGERGMRPEHLADRIATEAMILAAAGVPVGPHLADQLLIAMALAGSGTFRTVEPTLHCTTNARLIERFLPVAFTFAKDNDKGAYRVTCAPRR